MGAWRELFRISIEHVYRGDLPFRDWTMVPGAATAALMAATGIVARQIGETVVFLIAGERLPQLRARVADAGDAFPFLVNVHAADPYFATYTAPLVPPGQVLLVDSRDAVARGPAVQLHCGVCVDLQALTDADAPLCRQAQAGHAAPRRPAVIVHIALAAADIAAGRRYVVRFDAASSYWKYYVRGTLAARPLAIADLDAAVAFRRMDGAESAEGGLGRAAVFLSDGPIALRERPGQRFQLRERAPFGEKVLMKRMPVASAGLRQRVVVDGQAVLVSEIFINQ